MSDEDTLANSIGLTGYAVEAEGIGGVLKARVSDLSLIHI